MAHTRSGERDEIPRLTIPLLHPRLLETQVIPIQRDRWLVGFPHMKGNVVRFVKMVHCVF
jgi:hypothetical protein